MSDSIELLKDQRPSQALVSFVEDLLAAMTKGDAPRWIAMSPEMYRTFFWVEIVRGNSAQRRVIRRRNARREALRKQMISR